MDRFTECRLVLKDRAYTILGVTTARHPHGLTLVLHTAGGANPMLVLGKEVDCATLMAALDHTEDGHSVQALVERIHRLQAENAEMKQQRRFGLGDIRTLCGIISHSGPNREPLACAYTLYHDGDHSWATLPTF